MSSEVLTHPSIIDGWFHERSRQWPGQAMSLKVRRVLHVEQSQYQDVLVFESETYGNVLVLDGAIQCTERDEFSYQEMIAHLPINSHPNPRRVLVIGGGDGGVLREIVKHECVEEAVLCDIDEAVPRVSRTYLPKMAEGLDHPKAKVIIGDGFAFLKDPKNQGAFDVIITDSSDPDGPAEVLFQKSYFELLKGALRPGGHISTQAESMWVHLKLIRELTQSTRALFPVADYAYTLIPTYPCGQIGFVICSLDPQRDVRVPQRVVPNCRYYNNDIHRASFVMPEFAHRVVIGGEPAPGPVIATGTGEAQSTPRAPKKVLVLGSGYVAGPAIEYLLRYPEYEVTIGSSRNAAKLGEQFPRARTMQVDVKNAQSLGDAIAQHDLVISLIPYIYHADVIKAACQHKVDVVTTSYVSDAIRALEPEIKAAGITVMNEIGLDPGIDHLYAVKAIKEIHEAGGQVKSFLSYCGGLPAPEAATNPLGYKFSWSSRGVLLALRNTAKFIRGNQEHTVSGLELMANAKPYYIMPSFAFVAYPNRDSTPFREWYGIPEAEECIRGTLRYQGFPEFVLALVRLGFLDETAQAWLTASPLTWAQLTARLVGASATDEATLTAGVCARCAFKDEDESERVLQGMRWLGLFSDAPVEVGGLPEQRAQGQGNLLDTLCVNLEGKCAYEPGERDMVMLQHRFGIVTKDGEKKTLTSTLLDYGAPNGVTSMAKLVGVPCAIATRLVLEGHKALKQPGIIVPYTFDVAEPIRVELVKEGIALKEAYV
ncbi:saccharopine dehydrogenase (NADP+, L-glutamate-forming) [Malassezia pachydermatis]|uniref:Saccharopine dehydrogenase n=1 Tax=Malassezia pachydermatis TaxID=77020 RepID=A0A0M8MSD3_9BASI|nr:saccharopine dehydrogenase [Malassezia pachydermatis]KOS15807.1 saccharopine dehydrogenase [Malassezia pachydermatis]